MILLGTYFYRKKKDEDTAQVVYADNSTEEFPGPRLEGTEIQNDRNAENGFYTGISDTTL